MGAGKVLCIIGGILALVSTLFLSFYSIEIMPGVSITGYGIGIFLNFMSILESGEILAIVFSIIYIIGVVSGVFILIGIGVRALAIIGGIFALVLAILLIINVGLEISLGTDLNTSIRFFVEDPLVDGIIPFNFLIWGNVSIGTLTLAAGGVLGFIGGIIGSSDW